MPRMPRAADPHLVVLRDDRYPPSHHHGGGGGRARSRFFDTRADSLNRFGLSPHAPYTASRNLYELANACADTQSHAPHHARGRIARRAGDVLPRARGPLYDFLDGLGRPMDDCGSAMPFAHLWRSGSINENWLLVHMNELARGRFRAAGEPAARAQAARRALPRQPRLFPRTRLSRTGGCASSGANICLGTDSLASTHSLSLFDEMRRFWKSEPSLSAGGDPAHRHDESRRARCSGKAQLGRIAPGFLADLIAVPIAGGAETASTTRW